MPPDTDFIIMAFLLTLKALGLACDFLLYFLASSLFRTEVRRLFSSKRAPQARLSKQGDCEVVSQAQPVLLHYNTSDASCHM